MIHRPRCEPDLGQRYMPDRWQSYEPDYGQRSGFTLGSGPRYALDCGQRYVQDRWQHNLNCRTNLAATALLELRASEPMAQIHIN